MRPQDLIVALALHDASQSRSGPTLAELSDLAGLAVSQIHRALGRLHEARLVDANRHVRPSALHRFLVGAVAAVFPVQLGGPTRGFRTGASVFTDDQGVLPESLPSPSPLGWVWPHPEGDEVGLAVAPLHDTSADIARRAPRAPLHRALAALDLLRLGDARSAAFADQALRRFLGLEVRRQAVADITRPEALRQIFSAPRVSQTIHKWLGEHRTDPTAHPLEAPLLAHFGLDLATMISADVPHYRWRAQEGTHVSMAKGGSRPGGASAERTPAKGDRRDPASPGLERDTVWPALVDRIVVRRLVETLEVALEQPGPQRAFLARRFAASTLERGDYRAWFHGWQQFQRAQADAAASQALSVSFKTDVAEFFPSVGLDLARSAVARETRAHPDVLDLVFECLEAWRPRVGYHRQRGLPQDPVGLSGLAAHCVLRPVDEAFVDQHDRRYLRYVDDTVVFVSDEASAATVCRDHRRALARLGLRQNASKTETVSTARLMRDLDDKPFAAIDAAARSGDWLALRKLVKRHRGHDRLRRRLFTVLGRCQQWFLDDTLATDLASPGMRRQALRYWLAKPMDGRRWDDLREAWGRTGDGHGSILFARALAHARIHTEALVDEVSDWCERQVQHISWDVPGADLARGWLLLAVFRLKPKAARGLCAHASDHAPPAFRHFVDLVGLATNPGGWSAAQVPPWSDHGLSLRLMHDALAGRLEDAVALLTHAAPRPRDPVPAALWPLLHAIDAGLRERPDEAGRKAVKARLEAHWRADPQDLSDRAHRALFQETP